MEGSTDQHSFFIIKNKVLRQSVEHAIIKRHWVGFQKMTVLVITDINV